MKIILTKTILTMSVALTLGLLATNGKAAPLRGTAAQAALPLSATDISASRRPTHVRSRNLHTSRVYNHPIRTRQLREATRLRVYRDSYSWFTPYAPPVPYFFPFGYHLGYF